MYDWILFDADDTLLDFQAAAEKAFWAMIAGLELPAAPDWYQHYATANHATWKDYEAGTIDAATLRVRRFQRFLKAVDQVGAADPASMNRSLLEHLVQHTRPLPGAAELLQGLVGRVKMAIITNGLREVQRPRLRQLQWEHFFAAILVSDEMGYAKPHPRFFELTFRAIGHPPKERVLVVGDNLHSDIKGAKGFDLHACWYNPAGTPNQSSVSPDYTIANLAELPRILGLKAE